jgi:hypothetical protein
LALAECENCKNGKNILAMAKVTKMTRMAKTTKIVIFVSKAQGENGDDTFRFGKECSCLHQEMFVILISTRYKPLQLHL